MQRLWVATVLVALAGCSEMTGPAPSVSEINGDERMLAVVREMQRANPDVEYIDVMVRAMYAEHGQIEASGPAAPEPFRMDGSRELGLSAYPADYYDPDCNWDQLYIAAGRCALEGAGAYAIWPFKDPYSSTAIATAVAGLCYYQAYNDYCIEAMPPEGGGGSW